VKDILDMEFPLFLELLKTSAEIEEEIKDATLP